MPVDVEALRIQRTGPKTRRRRGRSWALPVIALAVLGLGWLLRAPILGALDRASLPSVRTMVVAESHPAAVGAVRGAASNGYIVAARRAALSTDIPGRIVEMLVTEGSVVARGDVVARLYAEEYRAALRRAEADVEVADANRRRAEAQLALAEQRVAQRRGLHAAAAANVRETEAGAQLGAVRLHRAQELVKSSVQAQDQLDVAIAADAQARAQVAASEARLAAAAVDIADAESQVAVARVDVEVTKAQISVAVANREQAAATLDKTEVRAPFAGIVVLKDAEIGEVVSPNVQGGGNARGAVCTMVDFDSLEAQAEVPETSLSAVTLGAVAEVFLDAYPDRRYRGRVDRIWPTANRQKATVEVRVKLDAPDASLRPEMGVRIVFLAADAAEATAPATGERRILVPEAAIVEIQGRPGVFVLERDVVTFTVIEVGDRGGGRAEVRNGLRTGQRIVLEPPPSLQTGDRVLLPPSS